MTKKIAPRETEEVSPANVDSDRITPPEQGSSKAELKARWMRAKWARERSERAIDRTNVRISEAKDAETRKTLTATMKEQRSVLSERKIAEALARSAYEEKIAGK